MNLTHEEIRDYGKLMQNPGIKQLIMNLVTWVGDAKVGERLMWYYTQKRGITTKQLAEELDLEVSFQKSETRNIFIFKRKQ